MGVAERAAEGAAAAEGGGGGGGAGEDMGGTLGRRCVEVGGGGGFAGCGNRGGGRNKTRGEGRRGEEGRLLKRGPEK